MEKKAHYEKRIWQEIRSLPEDALPKVIRILSLITEEFVSEHADAQVLDEAIDHKETRRLLASSESSWARDITADRADRI